MTWRCVVFTVRGETYSVPDGPTHMFSKIHIGVTVYLFNILSSGSSSHGCLKDITRVLGHNNFYAQIRLYLFNFKQNCEYLMVQLP